MADVHEFCDVKGCHNKTQYYIGEEKLSLCGDCNRKYKEGAFETKIVPPKPPELPQKKQPVHKKKTR